MAGGFQPAGSVLSVARSGTHGFSKQVVEAIRVIAGEGVEADAHRGRRVQHLSRVRSDPDQPNLRQVHLIHSELIDELTGMGFEVAPGSLGENITTRGIDLLALPRGALLRIGAEVELEVTGLRNPCAQIERFAAGLLSAVLDRTEEGELIRKAGVMAVALRGGIVQAGDSIAIGLPVGPLVGLQVV